MNIGQILGAILILSGVILSVALVVHEETGNNIGLSTFFSAYEGICFASGAITLFKTREKSADSKKIKREIGMFSEKN
ncbi:MAG: hypothetical protein WCI72_02370 [archaeon]